jgi:hypothetical protein
MIYTIEMGSRAMIYILNIVRLVRHSKVDERDSETHRRHGDLISHFYFIKIRAVG